jgi:site-specific DNA recombinase
MTSTTPPTCDGYLRLSDIRGDGDTFESRERKLRAFITDRLGWIVGEIITENDVDEHGRRKPASAWKRQTITLPDGSTDRRTWRPGFRSALARLASGASQALACEDLDRMARQPKDMEDLLDVIERTRGNARSISGTLTLTDGGDSNERFMARTLVNAAEKSSADTARRVRAARERQVETGTYGGGRRPYGFISDPDAPKYASTLLQVPEEAAEIERMAGAVLAGITLKAIARDLRERGVPTVTGVPWTPSTARDCLVKPMVAGLMVDGETEARWAGILPVDRWEAVRDKLLSPTVTYIMADGRERTAPRHTTTSPEPTHLVSGLAKCWKCGLGMKASGRRGVANPSYQCPAGHVRRQAAGTDLRVLGAVADLIDTEAPGTLPRQLAQPGVDVSALRAEERKLNRIAAKQAAMHAVGDLSDAELRAGSRARKVRLDTIASQLAAATEPDPLAEFRGEVDAAAVLAALPLARQREIVRRFVTVTIKPSARRSRFDAFDELSVAVEPIAAA